MQGIEAEVPDSDDGLAPATSVSDAENLRVLFAVDSRFPGIGGAEIQSIKLAKALRARGIQVDFVAPYLNRESPLEEVVEGFQLTKIDYPQIKLVGSVLLAAKFGWYLYQNQHKYDTVHIHITRILAAAAGLVKPFISCVVVTKISGFFEFQGGILDPDRSLNPANMLIRFALRKIDYVQTISVQTREKLEQAGFRPEQIKFIPNGIEIRDPAAENPAQSEPARALDSAADDFVIGYCGRMRTVKGVHVLLDGFARLKQNNPTTKLVLRVAGDGETEAELKQQASSLNLGDSIEFLGYIDDTASFLSTIDLYVQPSFAEGLPNSVIEAMNSGLAVVATDVGGNNDLVSHASNGRLFAAGDVEGLETELQWCLDNQAELPVMGQRGRQTIADSYGFAQVTDDLIALYSGSGR